MDEEDADNEEVQQQSPAPEVVGKETPSSTATDESVNNTNDEKRKANSAPTALAQTTSNQHTKAESQLLTEG